MAAWVDFDFIKPTSLFMAQTLFCSSCDYRMRPYITQWTDNNGIKWGRATLPDYCPRCRSKMENTFCVASSYHDLEKTDSTPAQDVVEVVRCKDCINHHEGGTCDSWSRYGRIVTRDDAYCSYGRRVSD